jgi:hypothetical protein
MIVQDFVKGISHSRHNATNNTWDIWCTFCESFNIDPTLDAIPDPIPLLHLLLIPTDMAHLLPAKLRFAAAQWEFLRTVLAIYIWCC